MRDATVTTATTHASIIAGEAAHFGAMAQDWWDPKGSSAMLHRLNPVRLGYIRAQVDAQWDGDPAAFAPLAGRGVLDVGCGAGLLTEPLARLGGAVTGIDAAAESIAVARDHARALTIDYRVGGIEAAAGETYDLVTCLEVVEHVADPATFVAGLAAAVAPGGLLIVSTPGRTWLSRLAMITIGESVGGIPRGTHDWDRFVAPDDLTAMVENAGLTVIDVQGLGFSPSRGFHLTASTALDYFVTATRAD